MLIKMAEQLARVDNLGMFHQGVVLENNDTKKIGRVKCVVPGMLEGTVAQLPWAYPMNPTGLGGGSTLSFFAVPEVGSSLVICFPYGDVYLPVYVGYWQTKQTHQTLFDGDYPDTYGFVDSLGDYIRVNKKQKTIEIKHGPSNSTISIDSDGNVDIHNTGDWTHTIGGDYSVDVTGTVKIKSGAKMELESAVDLDVKAATDLILIAGVKAQVVAPVFPHPND